MEMSEFQLNYIKSLIANRDNQIDYLLSNHIDSQEQKKVSINYLVFIGMLLGTRYTLYHLDGEDLDKFIKRMERL